MNFTSSEVDEAIRSILISPIPDDLQRRLDQRFAEFDNRLKQRPTQLIASRTFTRRYFHGILAASGAAIAAGVLASWHWSAPPAWAEIAEAASARNWIHMDGKTGNGRPLQFWFSLPLESFATKFGDTDLAHFGSEQRDELLTWRSQWSVIKKSAYRRPPGELGFLDTLLSAFASDTANVQAPGINKLLRQSRETLEREGQTYWQYSFTLETSEVGHKESYVVVFEVNPKTRLPEKWIRRSLDGTEQISFAIDFPDSGPADIYALGVPRDAKIVNEEQ